MEAASRKKEKEDKDQAAQKRNEEESKEEERRKNTEEVMKNNQQEIDEAMKKSKEEKELSNQAYRNIFSPQIDYPDKGIIDLNNIISREDMYVSRSLGSEQKDEEVRSPQMKKKKKDKKKDKKDKKTRRQKQNQFFNQEGLEGQEKGIGARFECRKNCNISINIHGYMWMLQLLWRLTTSTCSLHRRLESLYSMQKR